VSSYPANLRDACTSATVCAVPVESGRQLVYDAAESSTRRRTPQTKPKREGKVLTEKKRRKLIATTQDLRRNYAVAAWAIRKHLDYVSSFSFQAKTGDKAVDDRLETLMKWWGRRRHCDAARRHPLRRMVRLAEAHRVVDGDFFFYRLTDGSLQGIESDHVTKPAAGTPNNFKADDYEQGIKVKAGTGEALQYCICDRQEKGSQYEYRACVPARHIFPLGYFDRFDQVRGVSPLATAINTLQDTYEGFDYALAKLKVSQLFALAFFREGAEPLGEVEHDGSEDDDGNATKDGYSVSFDKGPVQLDLDPGDRAEFLESKTPAAETREFLNLMIAVALKSLDIPFSFFDESFTNFYGSRGGLMQYLKSCKNKQRDLADLLDEITYWRLSLFIQDGELQLPAGWTLTNLRWEWVPDGVPWWDPAKEVRGHAEAIARGLDNPQRVCRETGTDAFENIDKTAEVLEYAKKKGVPLELFREMKPDTVVKSADDDDGEK